EGGELKKEALPWWIFAVVGGFVTVWLAQKLFAGQFGFPGPGGSSPGPRWLPWIARAVAFIPGALVGGAIGWVLIRPGHRRVGLGLSAVQSLLRPDNRRVRLGRRQTAAAQHRGADCLCCAARTDLLAGIGRADRLHSDAGSGVPAGKCPVAGLGFRAAQ